MKRCVLLCAAPNANAAYCKTQIKLDDYIACADGGYDLAKKIGVKPDLVVGDFDSISNVLHIDTAELVQLPSRKDDTDTIYCLKRLIEKGFKEIILLGAVGGRVDHTFANITALKFLFKQGVVGVLTDDACSIHYTESKLVLARCKGKTVSVFPFGCSSAAITLNGFRYPLTDYRLLSDMPLGISNVVEDSAAEVQVHHGGVIVIQNHGQ